MPPDPMIAAREALDAGLPDAAYYVLLHITQAQPQNGEAWWMLALATRDPNLRATFEAKARATGVPAPLPRPASTSRPVASAVASRRTRRVPRKTVPVALLVILIGLAVVFWPKGSSATTKKASFPEVAPSSQGAIDVCKQFVADKVKPYTITRYSGTSPVQIATGQYQIDGSFLLKDNPAGSNRYTCQTRWTGDGKYTLEKLDLQ